MKISIDIEVSPEEARRFFGLPDVAPIQDHLIKRVQKQIDAASDPAYLGKLASQLVVGGVQSMDVMQKSFFELMGGAAAGKSSKPSKSGGKDRGKNEG